MNKFYAIGHITEDLVPQPHLGGGVSYSAVTAQRLGMDVHIITEAPPLHPYIAELERYGIAVHRLSTVNPKKEATTTTFKNYYDEAGHRKQILSQRQDDINLQDVAEIEKEIPIDENAIILVAPVIGEVDTELFPNLRNRAGENGLLVVTPQGYFREVDEEGNIERKPWDKVRALMQADMVILSDEDLTFDEHLDVEYLERIRELCPLVVLTKGSKGLTIFNGAEKSTTIKPFKLKKEELRDFTGAGDSCAASFIWYYSLTKQIREAGVFAALYPALKIMGVGGKEGGIGALPTLQQVEEFIGHNPERIGHFLKENGLHELRLSPEGNHSSPEFRAHDPHLSFHFVVVFFQPTRSGSKNIKT